MGLQKLRYHSVIVWPASLLHSPMKGLYSDLERVRRQRDKNLTPIKHLLSARQQSGNTTYITSVSLNSKTDGSPSFNANERFQATVCALVRYM